MIGSNNLSNSKLETKKLRFQAFRTASTSTDSTIKNTKSKATLKLQKNKTQLKWTSNYLSNSRLQSTLSDFLNGKHLN